MPSISQRAVSIPNSPIRKLAVLARKAEENGVMVYHLNLGEPDLLPPKSFFNAIHNEKYTTLPYEQSRGNSELISSVKDYYRSIDIDIAENQILITTGGSEAISFAMAAVADPGDSIAVFQPLYANYLGFAAQLGIHLIPITTTRKTGYHMPDAQKIRRHIGRNVRALLLCNPNNPTGTVYTKKEIGMCADICKRHNLYLIADEVYREYCYESKRHSILQENSIDDHTIVVDSFSKRFALCGARVGMVISRNLEVMSAILRMAQARLSSPSLEMMGVARMLQTKEAKTFMANTVQEFRKRRDVAHHALSQIPGVVCTKPMGAFYILAQLPVVDADAFCHWLITEFRSDNSTVLLTPGSGFYITPENGNNEVRIAYVLERKQLQQALCILAMALSDYSKLTKI